MDVTIRRAVPEDAHAVADVLIHSRAGAKDAIPPGIHPDHEVREWVRTVVIPARETWLALGPAPLAVLVLDDGWIDQLYVRPEATGQGIGSRLVDFAKDRRPAGLQLWTFQSNTGAQRFYQRHGFTVAETTDGSRNEEKSPDLRYIWP
ncbi:MAG TPA: GNAT family N-acetyltransferase [Actinoplanes sp.]|nr:GNAT family N-acetyltransferase [Actinoplanes sp.]